MEINLLNPQELEFKLENKMKKEMALKYEEAFDLKYSILKELKLAEKLHKFNTVLIKDLKEKLNIVEEIEKRIDLFLIKIKESEDKIIPKHNERIDNKLKEWQIFRIGDNKFTLEEIRCLYAYRVKLFSENYLKFLTEQKVRETKLKLTDLKEELKEINQNISNNLLKQGWIAIFWTFLLAQSIFSANQASANSTVTELHKPSRIWNKMLIQKNIKEVINLKNKLQDILLNGDLTNKEKEMKINLELNSIENKTIKKFLEKNEFTNLKDYIKLINKLNVLSVEYMI